MVAGQARLKNQTITILTFLSYCGKHNSVAVSHTDSLQTPLAQQVLIIHCESHLVIHLRYLQHERKSMSRGSASTTFNLTKLV